jgi:hypothetical protein
MAEFVAVGRVNPERAKFGNRYEKEMILDGIEVSLLIHSSQILIQADAPRDINPWTLRNVLRRGVNSQLDLYGFVEGRAFDAEITVMIDPSGDEWVFEREIPVLFNKFDSDEASDYINKMQALFEAGEAKYLHLSLRDFRLAITEPNETGFACYRAVESIRKHMHEIHDIPDDDNHRTDGWDKMHEELGTNQEEMIEMQQEFANERRHGGLELITDDQREHIFETTHGAICRYIDYLCSRLEEE